MNTLRARLDRTFKQLIRQAIAAAAAVIALFFFSLAAYSFIVEKYNAIVASLVLAAAYLVVGAGRTCLVTVPATKGSKPGCCFSKRRAVVARSDGHLHRS